MRRAWLPPCFPTGVACAESLFHVKQGLRRLHWGIHAFPFMDTKAKPIRMGFLGPGRRSKHAKRGGEASSRKGYTRKKGKLYGL